MHDKAAAQALQYLFQAVPFHRDDAAGKQTCLLQGKGIKRIPGALQLTDFIKLPVYIHISAVKDHLRLIDAFQLHHHRLLTVQQARPIQHRTAMLIAVRRGIAPSAAPVHTQRQFHGMGILHDVCRFIVAETAHRSLQHFRLDGSKALLHLVLILQHHTKVIMQAELLTEICPCKAFFQPVALGYSSGCFSRRLAASSSIRTRSAIRRFHAMMASGSAALKPEHSDLRGLSFQSSSLPSPVTSAYRFNAAATASLTVSFSG